MTQVVSSSLCVFAEQLGTELWNCIHAQTSVGIDRHYKCEVCIMLGHKTAEYGI